jgi:AAA domain, putative AbiEii toxin, Type IV TA system
MDRILFRDVRCFRGEHDIPFAPLTFLVGENSTGKSTILALLRVGWEIGYSREEPDFNADPFLWGGFDEIAHYHGGQGKRARTFSAGYWIPKAREMIVSESKKEVAVQATFSPRVGQPTLSALEVSSGLWGVRLCETSSGTEVLIRLPSGEHSFKVSFDGFLRPLSLRGLEAIVEMLLAGVEESSQQGPTKGQQGFLFSPVLRNFSSEFQNPFAEPTRREEVQSLALALGFDPSGRSLYRSTRLGGAARRPLAVAPVRTKPKRTYDPLREVRSAEGEHVPMMLARLRSTEPETWKDLTSELTEYGRGAGLFSGLEVRRFGKGESAPFQVHVRLAGQRKEVNLVDVGYGVSQVLPILVDAFTQPEGSSFLLQQPEVHLHPKAQAELGSMLVSLVKRRRHKFMIETHSDHLVDRVRLEVKRGKIPAEDVRIVYCERADSHVLTHEIKVDANGNLIGAPEGYRQFFLDEELALLGG